MSLKLPPLTLKLIPVDCYFLFFGILLRLKLILKSMLSGEQDSEYVSYSRQLNNLPGSSTRNTQTVKNIKSYVKKVDEEENDVAEGAVIPEKYNNAS